MRLAAERRRHQVADARGSTAFQVTPSTSGRPDDAAVGERQTSAIVSRRTPVLAKTALPGRFLGRAQLSSGAGEPVIGPETQRRRAGRRRRPSGRPPRAGAGRRRGELGVDREEEPHILGPDRAAILEEVAGGGIQRPRSPPKTGEDLARERAPVAFATASVATVQAHRRRRAPRDRRDRRHRRRHRRDRLRPDARAYGRSPSLRTYRVDAARLQRLGVAPRVAMIPATPAASS